MKKTNIILSFLVILLMSGGVSAQFAGNGRSLKGHKTSVNDLAFSPDGAELYSCGGNKQVIVFNPGSGDIKRSCNAASGHTSLNDISLSADGSLLAYSGFSSEIVTLCDAKTLKETLTINGMKSVDDHCFSPTENIIAICGFVGDPLKQSIALYSVETGNMIRQIFIQSGSDKTFPTSIDFSPDGKYLACGISNANQGVRIYDVSNANLIRTIPYETDVNVVRFSPDGKYIAGGTLDKKVVIWNVEDGNKLRSLSPMSGYVMTLDYAPDGKTIAAAGYDHTCTFKLWNTETGDLIQSLDQKGPDIQQVCFNPTGSMLAVALRTYGDAFEVSTILVYGESEIIATNDKDDWKKIQCPEASVSASLPLLPEKKYSKDQNYENFQYIVNTGGHYYCIMANKYLYTIDDNKRKSAVNKKISTYKENRTVKSESDFSSGSYKGKDLVVTQNGQRFHYRIIFVKDILYQIIYTSKEKEETPQEIKFLESITFE